MKKRIEFLLDEGDMIKLDGVAGEVGATRSFLIRKAISLYLINRKEQVKAKRQYPW